MIATPSVCCSRTLAVPLPTQAMGDPLPAADIDNNLNSAAKTVAAWGDVRQIQSKRVASSAGTSMCLHGVCAVVAGDKCRRYREPSRCQLLSLYLSGPSTLLTSGMAMDCIPLASSKEPSSSFFPASLVSTTGLSAPRARPMLLRLSQRAAQ